MKTKKKIQKVRYGWYVIRNVDPINELKLKNIRYGWCVIRGYIVLYKLNETRKIKVRMVRYQRLPPCNFIKTQKIRYGWYVIRNCRPGISLKYNKTTDGMVLETAAL